jgi:hypothetical protein
MGGQANPTMTLLSGYFNEDWEEDHSPTWQNVIAAFVRETSSDGVKDVIDDLGQLITSNLSEEDLVWLLKAIGSNIRPEGFGLGNRQWFAELRAELVRPALDNRPVGDGEQR